MNEPKFVYYIAFPVVTACLCAFSYYLGWARGKQVSSFKEMSVLENSLVVEETPESSMERDPQGTVALETISEATHEQTGKLAVQVSAFQDIGKAHELVNELRINGYRASVRSEKSKDRPWHRVFVGPFDNRNEAQRISEEINEKRMGKGFVVVLDW